MIKVIAFDLGGVLFTEGKSVLVKKLFDEYDYDPETILKVLKSPESKNLRKGIISDEEFWSWVQDQLPEYDAQLIKKEWYDSYVIDDDINDLLKKLRSKYKLMIFSGNVKSRVEYLDIKYNFRKMFDSEVYSYDYGFCKPEKEFVEAMIKVSEVLPQEILYIDDQEKDANVATEFGVNVLIYKRGMIKELLRQLEKNGVKVND